MHRWLRILLLSALALALLWPREVLAIEYEVFIDVDTEDDLYDLYVTGQISEDTFYTLVELRRNPVDLNEATREQLYSLPNLTYDDVDAILAYREEVGVIHAPADLAAAGVVTRDKLGSVLTFIRAYDKRRKLTATHVWMRYQTAWSPTDRMVPPMALQARVTTLRQLTLGAVGFITRQRPGDPVWDPTRDALVAPEMAVRAHAPKYFVQWDTDRFGVIAGTYRVGFGQRLVFDNTNRYTPNGFYFDDTVVRSTDLGLACRESSGEQASTPCPSDSRTYVTKDLRWRDGLRGLALGAKHLSLPVGWLQIYGFGSWQTRQIYQTDLTELDVCEDPRESSDTCATVRVLVSREGQAPLEPTTSHLYQTLPNMYDEFLGGANFTWFYDRRTHVGVTGYGATVLWRPEGADLDFRRSSTNPFGGPWGAVGADMAWGYRWSDLAIEVARSFDSMPQLTQDPDYGGGGYAGIVRQTSTFGTHEIEVSGRIYDRNYANPFAGPISQSDEYHGNRARDEAGGRVRYGGRIADRLDLRAVADVWAQLRDQTPKLETYVRGDVDVNDWFRPGLWLKYRNVDLRPAQLGCFASADEGENPAYQDSTDRSSGCISEMGQVTPRLSFRMLDERLTLTAQYQHEFIRDPTIVGRLRQDISPTVIINAKPAKSLRLTLRFRHLFEDVADNGRYQQWTWAYLDLAYTIRRVFTIQARYDFLYWLDQRGTTLARTPNPEHRLRLVLEARF